MEFPIADGHRSKEKSFKKSACFTLPFDCLQSAIDNINITWVDLSRHTPPLIILPCQRALYQGLCYLWLFDRDRRLFHIETSP